MKDAVIVDGETYVNLRLAKAANNARVARLFVAAAAFASIIMSWHGLTMHWLGQPYAWVIPAAWATPMIPAYLCSRRTFKELVRVVSELLEDTDLDDDPE